LQSRSSNKPENQKKKKKKKKRLKDRTALAWRPGQLILTDFYANRFTVQVLTPGPPQYVVIVFIVVVVSHSLYRLFESTGESQDPDSWSSFLGI
jgi:hypothetical protein